MSLAMPSAEAWAGVRDWVIGIGTLGTLAASVVVLRRQGDEIDSQSAERREAAAFARSAQAREVRLSPVRTGGSGISRQYSDKSVTFSVLNESDDAVHDVEIGANIFVEGDPVPSTNPKLTFDLLAVGEHADYITSFRVQWDSTTQDLQESRTEPYVLFTDMAGQRWRRDHQHRLAPSQSNANKQVDPSPLNRAKAWFALRLGR